jgi:hypothetical protein
MVIESLLLRPQGSGQYIRSQLVNKHHLPATYSPEHSLFLFVTASGRAPVAADLAYVAIATGWSVYLIQTPNVTQVLPAEQLYQLPNVQPIRHYGDPPLDRFPFGTMLVAPCTFNTLNKLSQGIADNLALAMLADALGAGCRVLVAPAMNVGLWHHPQTARSLQTLTDWGCTIIPPQVDAREVTMATNQVILAALGAP